MTEKNTSSQTKILPKKTVYDIKTAKALYQMIWFYGISTVVGYLILNYLFTYIKYIIWKHIFLITCEKKPGVILLHTDNCCLALIILLNITH